MKLYNVKLSGYFGTIKIDELSAKHMIYSIADQFQAEALTYSNFNNIGEYRGYKTYLNVEAEYIKVKNNDNTY